MKFKIILSLLLITVTSSSLKAQDERRAFRVTPKIGLGFSMLNTEANDQTQNDHSLLDAKGRFNFTAGADFRIGRSFFFTFGGHYNMLNASLTSRSIDSNVVNNFKDNATVNYLKVPVGVGYYLTGTGGIVDLNLTLGISNYFLLSENTEFYSKSDFKSYNVGFNIGVNLDIIRFLHVGINYDLGMSKLFTDYKGKNQVLSLTLGVNIP